MSLNILKKCALRVSYSENGINDTSFCHGTAGAYIFFSILSAKYGLIEFESTADFWFDQTLTFNNGMEGIKRFRSFDKYYKDLGIISGLSGVLLSIISKDDKTQLAHLEEMYML